MRPRRLELEGFTSFRERTVVDFDGAEVFALSGATGAGKSSLIDAIVFALYGCVPRYDDQRAVAPVITQGKNEAVLGLEFSVGADDYVATRVVRRTKGKGATTKEARLERLRPGGDPEVLAGTADEVSAAVEEILGLGFDHFTRCVVLPQGEFAQFLLDKPRDRQELLIRLLDLGVYERMGEIARARASGLGSEIKVLEGKLEQVGAVSPELVAAAEQRQKAAEALESRLAEAEPELQRYDEAVRSSRTEAAEAEKAIEALAAVKVPEGVGDLAEDRAARQTALQECAKAEAEAEDTLGDAKRKLAAQRDPGELAKLIADHKRRDGMHAELDASEGRLASLATAAAEAAKAAASAEDLAEQANERLGAVHDAHRAHTLAGTLVVGEPCPVCTQTVAALPELTAPDEVSGAEAALAAAKTDAKDATARSHAVAKELAGAEAARDALRDQVAELAANLAEAPTAEECAREQQRRRDHEADCKRAETEFDAARKATARAREALKRAEGAEQEARALFQSRRDGVAAWSPPEAGNTDLREDWKALADWAKAVLPGYEETLSKSETDAAEAEEASARLIGDLASAAEPLGIMAPTLPDLRTSVPKTAEQARGAHERAVKDLQQAEQLRSEVEDLAAAKRVADSLGTHLKKGGDGFQTWLQREAQEQLVVGASKILEELSVGAYSLALDDKAGFDVIDHRNADQARSARTLSGGETFLASLALALALGDHIASMAAHGSARLESLFLDEGFGTLDPDTLDVVAAAIEELGSRGRVVGLVTHVRDLAERVPVRFEVTKGPGGSSVERVEA